MRDQRRRPLASALLFGLVAAPSWAQAPECGLGSMKDIRECCGEAHASVEAQFSCFEEGVTYAFGEFVKQWEAYKKIRREEADRFKKRLDEHWDQPEISTQSVWVEYSEDLKERRSVDFEKQTITLELSADENDDAPSEAIIREKLSQLVTKNTAEAFEVDAIAQAVEERSTEELADVETAEVPEEPILLSYLTGLTGKAAAATGYVGEIVDHMVEHMQQAPARNERGRKVHEVEVPLKAPETGVVDAERKRRAAKAADAPPSKLPARAAAFWDHVVDHAGRWNVDRALVYAVMETESNFSPTATSHIPAYGLMQIVPGSAGKDVTMRLSGKPRILAPSYLYVPANNIQAGSTYLDILDGYFGRIEDPLSRLYCKIAGYNAGPGGVARAVSNKPRLNTLAAEANRLTPDQVHARLMKRLPDEAKHYLKKVHGLMQKYEGYGL